MNLYRVFGGVARIGAGQLVRLAADQIKARAHNLEIPKEWDGRADAEVRPKIVQEFKVGETLGLEGLEKHLIGIVEPVGEPQSKTDQVAAAAAEQHRERQAVKAKGAAGGKSKPRAKPPAKRKG